MLVMFSRHVAGPGKAGALGVCVLRLSLEPVSLVRAGFPVWEL